jgi:hypothetical protein
VLIAQLRVDAFSLRNPTLHSLNTDSPSKPTTVVQRTTTTRATTLPLYSTWSNGQAVQGYQDFLSSGKQEIELTPDTSSVFIHGMPTYDPYNNVINALLGLGMGQYDDTVISCQFDQDLPESINGNTEYPIYITIPPTQLGYFLDNLPPSYMARIDDFVFFSGGFEFGNIEDVLKDRGTVLHIT